MANISYSYVPDQGWTGTGFSITHSTVPAQQVTMQIQARPDAAVVPVEIQSVEVKGDSLVIQTAPFRYRSAWQLKIGEDTYTRDNMDEEKVEGFEVFEPFKKGEVLYRLYSPKATTPRPLLLFLHGGGNGGTDNIQQVCTDYGIVQFAQKYPDFYVMCPTAPQPTPTGLPVNMGRDFAHSDMTGKFGWYREYLAAVCDIIREMIAEGKVDGRRVYVTGMSMGGAGTIRAMSVGAGLFAAAVPICPTMTPETFHILCGLVDAKIWIATAYVDHTIYRHKYIVDGIMALRDAGNQDAHLTLYSPEELAAYGIATDPDLTLQERFSANHASWIPTYHDEHGIMSWMIEQTL